MVFKSEGARTFKLKLSIPTRNDGRPRTFSTGTTVKAVAQDVERMIGRFKARREWAALEAIFDGHLTLAEVYDADARGTLDELLVALRDVDLDALVTTWAKRANAKYVTQVRALIAEGERFPVSAFRRKRISEFLADLTCSDPTKNRYRAALSVFAKWLVEREVLDTNPVRDVAMYREHDPRMTWMTWADAKRVAEAMPEHLRALVALLAGAGLELGAAVILDRGDVDLDATTVHARGSKTLWRNRIVRAEPWAMPFLKAHVRGMLAGPLFADLRASSRQPEYRAAVQAFRAAQAACGLSGHRFHDLRHTYAVNALRQGYKPAVVAHQLGHKDASMVTKVYGRFVPDESDYVVTNPVTTTSSVARGRHA